MKIPTRFHDNRETLRPHPMAKTKGVRRRWMVGAVLSGTFALMCPAQSVVDLSLEQTVFPLGQPLDSVSLTSPTFGILTHQFGTVSGLIQVEITDPETVSLLGIVQFLGTSSSEADGGFSNSSGFRIAADPAMDGMVARVSLTYNLISSTTEGVPFIGEDFGSYAESRTFFRVSGGSTLDPEDTIRFTARTSSVDNAPTTRPESASGSETC